MFFTHNTQYSLLFLIHVQIQCDLAITRFTCVNVCSLNCLDLKYKNWLDLFSVCVCVCVFWDPYVLKIFIERWFWELNMLIGSLVELHVGLHSCLCFSYLEKLVLKAGSTPLWYLFDTLLYVKLLQLFLIAILTASWYLVDWSSFCSWFYWVVPRHLLDTSAVDNHFSTPSSTGVSIPLDTCICRDLLLALFKLPV